MAKSTKYQGFRNQAKKDRTIADEKLNSAETVKSLSDEEVKKIATEMYCWNDVKVVTLEDGTKAFGDNMRFGIITQDGVFSVLERDGVSIQHGDLVKGKVENQEWLEGENLSKYVENIKKLKEAAPLLDRASAVDKLSSLEYEASLPKLKEEAEHSPQVQQAKEVAVKSLGFDEKSLNVKILSTEDIGLVAKDGFAVGHGNTYYFIPNAKELSDNCALKEVKLSNDGTAPVIKDIPLNEDTAKFVDTTYNKLAKEVYGSSDDYKKQIKEINQKAENTWQEKERAEKEAKEYAENSKMLSEQFTMQVDKDENNKVFRVGHWGNKVAGLYDDYAKIGDKSLSAEERQKALESFKKRKEAAAEWITPNESQDLRVELKNMNQKAVDSLDESLAYYSPDSGQITMKSLTEEKREELKEQLKKQTEIYGERAKDTLKEHSTLFELNDTMAQLTTLYHENNHKNDYDNSGAMSLYKTPKNVAKSNRLTETKSTAVEYLSAAHQYTEMKKQGISTIEINGEQKPLEYMLEMYKGLKEVVDENGFDINDKQSVRRVVEAASKDWHSSPTRVEHYNEQAASTLTKGLMYLNLQPMSEQLKLLKNENETYQDVSDNMLKNTYIGQNTVVDLRHCRDLLDTMTDNDVQKIRNGAYLVSYDELKSVNDYLEQKGIKKDGDKMKYMSEHLNQLAYRNGQDNDPQLTNLLLSYNNSILCADGLEYSKGANGAIVCHKDGKDYAMNTVPQQKSAENSITISAFQQQNTR